MDSGLWSLDTPRRTRQVTERNLAAKIIRTRGAFRRFTTGHNEVCGNWHWKA
ncbi:hypothetical protein GQ55_3G166000 [Panicum hallii var. hallii]|uniref:Uncharacterized protein n=1 Tax=Panicum hallii var. hallii TaxID=1504633 RepID=A0A2T7EA62_9POAL|nr:hypothetical protein GQ55_3G166000 [Panicum hallii var. hallii]